MLRWLGILVAICLCSTSADAQVFKPKAKKAAPAEKKAAAPKKAAKKQPRAAPTKKRPGLKAKKKKGAAPKDAGSEDSDRDYVKIWDDDEIE